MLHHTHFSMKRNQQLSDFSADVYRILRSIPQGKVITYGQLAARAGNPKAARYVGFLMRTNSDIPHTPCHRVVAADGSLHGYSGEGGIEAKKLLLIQEGVQFKNGKVDLSISAVK